MKTTSKMLSHHHHQGQVGMSVSAARMRRFRQISQPMATWYGLPSITASASSESLTTWTVIISALTMCSLIVLAFLPSRTTCDNGDLALWLMLRLKPEVSEVLRSIARSSNSRDRKDAAWSRSNDILHQLRRMLTW